MALFRVEVPVDSRAGALRILAGIASRAAAGPRITGEAPGLWCRDPPGRDIAATPDEIAGLPCADCKKLAIWWGAKLTQEGHRVDLVMTRDATATDGEEHVLLRVDGRFWDPSEEAGMPPRVLGEVVIVSVLSTIFAGKKKPPQLHMGGPGAGPDQNELRYRAGGRRLWWRFYWCQPFIDGVILGLEAAARSLETTWQITDGLQRDPEIQRLRNGWQGDDASFMRATFRGAGAIERLSQALEGGKEAEDLDQELQGVPWPRGQHPGQYGLARLAVFIAAEAQGYHALRRTQLWRWRRRRSPPRPVEVIAAPAPPAYVPGPFAAAPMVVGPAVAAYTPGPFAPPPMGVAPPVAMPGAFAPSLVTPSVGMASTAAPASVGTATNSPIASTVGSTVGSGNTQDVTDTTNINLGSMLGGTVSNAANVGSALGSTFTNTDTSTVSPDDLQSLLDGLAGGDDDN